MLYVVTALCIAVLFPGPALAKSLYVSGYREVPVRTAPGADGSVMTSLKTGDEVSLVSNTGDYYLVMLPNGSRGYIAKSALTEQEPAETRLQKLDQSTQKQIKELQEKTEDQERRLAALRKEREQLEQARQSSESKALEQTRIATRLQAQQDVVAREANIKWFFAGVAVTFGGFIFGLIWSQVGRKNRRSSLSLGRLM